MSVRVSVRVNETLFLLGNKSFDILHRPLPVLEISEYAVSVLGVRVRVRVRVRIRVRVGLRVGVSALSMAEIEGGSEKSIQIPSTKQINKQRRREGENNKHTNNIIQR